MIDDRYHFRRFMITKTTRSHVFVSPIFFSLLLSVGSQAYVRRDELADLGEPSLTIYKDYMKNTRNHFVIYILDISKTKKRAACRLVDLFWIGG
jgi:hypothetical protein